MRREFLALVALAATQASCAVVAGLDGYAAPSDSASAAPPDRGTNATQCAAPASCRALHDRSHGAKTGFYDLSFAPGGACVRMYCDMDNAGGGWTLVGRSADSAPDTTPFGWSIAAGDATNAN